jgi:hypothetical protein
MDQEGRAWLDRLLDDLRTAIREETAKTCEHIDAFGERLKPGRFLRYLEARAAECADRAEIANGRPGPGAAQRSVVYAVPPAERDAAPR